jgi:NADH-quinone oxidoreductase subunit N
VDPSFSIGALRPYWADLAVFLGAVLCLGMEMIFPQEGRKTRVRLAALGSLSLAVALLASGSLGADPFPGHIAADGLALMTKLILLVACATTIATGWEAAEALGLEQAEYYALLLLATFGMMALSSATHLLSAFVSLEVFSLSMYVLAGFNKRLSRNREAALKYFLTGAFAAAFFLFGMALLFWVARTVQIEALAKVWQGSGLTAQSRLVFMAGLVMVVLAYAFKIGLVPFHAWVPDTYEGAATPVSGFLSAAAKAVGLTAMIRLLMPLFPVSGSLAPGLIEAWQPMAMALGLLAALTMTYANLVALKQQSIKRMLAYSSIAHSGYALLGVLCGNEAGMAAALTYALIYMPMAFLGFGIALALEKPGQGQGVTFDDLNGLGFAQPLLGLCLGIAAFSLAGLPPTGGFTAKFGLFKAAYAAGYGPLVLLGVLNSVIGAGYYLRLLIHCYMRPLPAQGGLAVFSGIPAFLVVLTALFLLLSGVFPQAVLALIGSGGGLLLR